MFCVTIIIVAIRKPLKIVDCGFFFVLFFFFSFKVLFPCRGGCKHNLRANVVKSYSIERVYYHTTIT